MARYSIGIDLGTTHSALSYFDLQQEHARGQEQAVLPIPQLTALGTVEEHSLLPSFLYLPAADEFPPHNLALPWDDSPQEIVGVFARSHGSKVPGRLISSAKSWLCHSGAARSTPLLPWQAPPDVPAMSPLDASTRYLAHLQQAWSHRMAAAPDSQLEKQDVILTVPASFDAAARDLTMQAALNAGLKNVVLLEEPQAALYAWLEAQGDHFRKQISPGDVILVIDLGGGTTDLSLIAVTEEQGEIRLIRLAVGDHILLGGDNMDLTLAHSIQQQLNSQGKKLDAWQFNALTHSCRQAKEQLFAAPDLEAAPVTIPSRGSALIGGTIKTELSRSELERILTDGFFPKTAVTELPQSARRIGLTQIGLPYAQDPAVTRHVASFLVRQARHLPSAPDIPITLKGKDFTHPTAVLFNGGVFNARPLRQRMLNTLNEWLAIDGGDPVKELQGGHLDLAVARGAAYYGWVRTGHGIRIRGGTARAYYVGVESAQPAVPGFEPPVKALCVAPFGMEEGTQADIPPQEFGLIVGEPTQFRFFASSVRREDRTGDMLEDASSNEELEELAPVETNLAAGDSELGRVIPIHLQAAVTEVGTLELRCLERNGPGQWNLELNIRSQDEQEQ